MRDVEALREHYALTLRRWVANLEADWARAVRLDRPRPGPRLAALHGGLARSPSSSNRIGVNQVLAVRTPEATGASGLPLRSRTWT